MLVEAQEGSRLSMTGVWQEGLDGKVRDIPLDDEQCRHKDGAGPQQQGTGQDKRS